VLYFVTAEAELLWSKNPVRASGSNLELSSKAPWKSAAQGRSDTDCGRQEKSFDWFEKFPFSLHWPFKVDVISIGF
jgi:hypothetical protein